MYKCPCGLPFKALIDMINHKLKTKHDLQVTERRNG